MNSSKKIIELTKEHNGIITSKIVTKAGISRGSLKYLVDNNLIKKLQEEFIFYRELGKMNLLVYKPAIKEVYFQMKQPCFFMA